VVPIIYGDSHPRFVDSARTVRLPIDVFGSAYFMLTRYEEIVIGDRDQYDRFPSRASVAGRDGFLDRPIIDEYVEILWAAMRRLWPNIVRRQRAFSVALSHDVDRPARYMFATAGRLVRRVGGDVLRGEVSGVVRAVRTRLAGRQCLPTSDPANTFDWIMERSERLGLRSAFYFMAGRTNNKFDADYEVEAPAIRDLLRKINKRGHEIGLHPSFETYLAPDMLAREADRLRAVCRSEGISQKKWGGRMHYLRWRHPITLNAWSAAGMDYDSTLGYPELAGFRCGTCHEYSAFDAQRRVAIATRIRPLVAMEGSILAKQYMNLGETDAALAYFEKLKNACRCVLGNFTLLWHNSELETSANKRLYELVLQI
jgi:hypothetical protein